MVNLLIFGKYEELVTMQVGRWAGEKVVRWEGRYINMENMSKI